MEYVSRGVVTAILLGLAIANVVWAIGDWRPHDLLTYVDAARQWVETGSPYSLTPRAEEWMLYRYAPWFAALFVPLLGVPLPVLHAVFSALMAGCSILAVVPMLRRYGWRAAPVAAFLGTMLFGIGAAGNVQPLMVAVLAWTVGTRFGPIGIAFAASLKLLPLLFVLPYLGQREWGKAAATFALTLLLLGPIVLFELPGRALDAGPSNSLIHVNVVLWAIVAASAVLVAAYQSVRGEPYRWLAVCAAVILASPRFIGYDLTILLASTPYQADDATPARPSRSRAHPRSGQPVTQPSER
ncbi:MAG: hypothetical protein ABIO99_06900 [Candidatus Limnocylindria bacterium]